MGHPSRNILLLCALSACHGPSQPDEPHQALILVSPARLELGSVLVGALGHASLDVRNDGNVVLEIHATSLLGGDAWDVDDKGPWALQPGEQRMLSVTFQPLSEGDWLAELRLDNNSENAPHQRVSITATAQPLPSCDDLNPCTRDVYFVSFGQCGHEPVPGTCNDGNACTNGDRCDQGVCVGEPVICDDGMQCTSEHACHGG